ncbi:unnamed protein product [Staurois parvus]|uniref:Uncharacterized protein n=1 Tax=Staurois parvus TaxID=386267 RepID=A0ABN9ARG7_9NEOB|nr:unnamed protein product [Staurois parvus]
MPVSAAYQCCHVSAADQVQSLPPNSASQCHLTVPVSAT